MKGKRSKGEGTVWQTASGTWRGQIMDGFRDDGKKNMIILKCRSGNAIGKCIGQPNRTGL